MSKTPGLLAVAVALALVLRLLIPAGFMPASGNGGPLVICTGHGPLTAPGDGPVGPAKGKAVSTCAFAALAIPLQPAPPVLTASAWMGERPTEGVASGHQVIGGFPAARPPPAIGPPVSV